MAGNSTLRFNVLVSAAGTLKNAIMPPKHNKVVEGNTRLMARTPNRLIHLLVKKTCTSTVTALETMVSTPNNTLSSASVLKLALYTANAANPRQFNATTMKNTASDEYSNSFERRANLSPCVTCSIVRVNPPPRRPGAKNGDTPTV